MPYRLFALSNLASILGLLAYPVLVEPYLSLRHQFQVWSWGYLLFVLLYLVSALRNWQSARGTSASPAADSGGMAPEPSWDLKLLWMLFAACACILLLAITNYLTQNIAPVPFLWVLPLGVYLLTFVFCFNDDRSSEHELVEVAGRPHFGGTWHCPFQGPRRRADPYRRDLRRGAVSVLHVLSQRAGTAETAPALSHILLPDDRAGRRDGRGLRGIDRSGGFQCLLRIARRDGTVRAAVAARPAAIDLDAASCEVSVGGVCRFPGMHASLLLHLRDAR